MQCKSLTWRLKLIGRGVLYTALFTVSVAAAGNEYFVSTDGDDARNGRLVDQAFRTIQRGVDALEEGDTLTILPGEYFESVDRENLGGPDRETLIRAVIPGTVLLRGDVPIPPLEPVEGRPFVYATDFDRDVQIVNERDTLSMLTRAVNIADLEFLRGGFYHDSDAGRLYISTTHLAPPDFRAYTVSVLGTHGLYLERPQRVTIDGLAATGFNNAEIMATYPGYRGAWGIIIGRGLDCVIRNCTAFFNGGGIALFTGYTAHGREPGRGNVIEHGRAWANASRFISEGANIAAYSVNHDVIRDCEAYRAGRGIRLYGAIGPGTLKRSLAWDSSIQLKGGLLHRIGGAGLADRVVALRDAHVHDLTNSLVARGNAYHRGIETPRDNIRLAHEKEIDLGREFADPANRDYRLQDGSRFIGAAPDGSDRGPYPYEANIFFVRTDGDDAADGLSMEGAWRTPGHAARRLRPGDTLYLAPGAHRGGAEIETTEGDPVLIRGRGLEPVELTGAVHVRGPGSVEFERIRFSGPVTIAGGRDVVFRHCTFSEDDAPLTLSGTTGVRIEHGLFPAGGPSFQECSDIHLSGNVFEGTAQPVVVVDELAKVAYSDYNVYPAHARSAWRVGGRNIAASDLRPVHERYSRIGGKKYVTAGPFGRDAGPYRPPAESVLRVTPPVVHAVTDKTADIEWRTSERVDVTLTWSTVADGPDARRRERWPFGAYGFSTYSLTGLEPDTEYEFRLSYETPVRPAGTDEETEELTVAFRTAAMPREPVSWYVAPDGDDAADGRSREQALRTVNAAAARARAGDTVWIAGGTYTEIVQVRSTGTEGRPLTFRSVPGEKVVFDGRERSLPHAFMVTGKAHIHLDGFYFTGFGFGARRRSDRYHSVTAGAVNLYIAPDARVTRCFSDGRGHGYAAPMVGATHSPRLLIRNSVIAASSQGVRLRTCHNARLENNVFFRNLIQQYMFVGWPGEHDFYTERNVIIDSPANKVKSCLLEIPNIQFMRESDNCYFLRVPDQERKMFLSSGERLSLADVQERYGDSGSFIADPMFEGAAGIEAVDAEGHQVFLPDRLIHKRDLDFPDLFAANPKLVERGIGLQPEAFKDFHFTVGD